MVYTLEWHDTKSGEHEVCEVEGGVAYDCYADRRAAQYAADQLNANAERNGFFARYEVIPVPSHLKAYGSEHREGYEDRRDDLGESLD